MFQLTSERLTLIPLNLNQLELLAQSRVLLEQSLDLQPFGLQISIPEFVEEFQQALQTWMIPRVAEHEFDYQWFTSWLIVHRVDNRSAGTLGIAGLPNEQGEVLIGYFTDARYERQGIMTEAVERLLIWVFENPEVQCVIADTLVEGIASQRVLQKNGFVQAGTTDEGLRWRKQR